MPKRRGRLLIKGSALPTATRPNPLRAKREHGRISQATRRWTPNKAEDPGAALNHSRKEVQQNPGTENLTGRRLPGTSDHLLALRFFFGGGGAYPVFFVFFDFP